MGQFQLVIEKLDTRIWRGPKKRRSPRNRRKVAGASGVPSKAAWL